MNRPEGHLVPGLGSLQAQGRPAPPEPAQDHNRVFFLVIIRLREVLDYGPQAVRGFSTGHHRDPFVIDAEVRLEGSPSLLRVLLDEAARRLEDFPSKPEGLGEGFGPGVAQVLGHMPDQADAASRESVYGLPVVSHEEVGQFGLLQHFQQFHSPCGYILELVHQNMGVPVLGFSTGHAFRCLVDEIVEVYGLFFRHAGFVIFSDLPEDFQESVGTLTVTGVLCSPLQLLMGQIAGLSVIQEGAEQTA